jgi:hypothetical protein
MSEKINTPLTKRELLAGDIYQLSKLQALSSAPNFIDIDHDQTRTHISRPRLNWLLNLKPNAFRKVFNCIITTQNYYFWPTVLIFVPPVTTSRAALPKNKISFTALFYIMHQINIYGTEYQLSPVVEKFYTEFFTRAESNLKKANTKHIYLA